MYIMSVSSSNDFLHIWKTYNDTNSQFLETYRSFQTRTQPVASATSSTRTSNRRNNPVDTAPPSWLQQMFSSGRSPYISDISYSWVFEVPTASSSASSSLPSRLTQKQIQENTRTFVFNDVERLNTTTCPISQNDFQTGDILCEINTCKHVFKQEEILRWFDINTSCPVCRNPVSPVATTRTESTANQPRVLDEIVLTPLTHLFSSQGDSSSQENDEMTQMMNEALETIFSGRTPR